MLLTSRIVDVGVAALLRLPNWRARKDSRLLVPARLEASLFGIVAMRGSSLDYSGIFPVTE